MKTYIMFLSIIVMASTVIAQQNPGKGGGKPMRPGAEQRQEKVPIDFSIEPATAPVDELDVNEFLLKRKDLHGQVIELTFDKVISLKQGAQGYIASVSYENPRSAEGMTLMIPTEGLEMFEKLSKPKVRSKESIYIEVVSPGAVKVLGTRYSKTKPEGERYNW